MNIDEKYDLITNSLRSGTVEDWEHLARQFPDFPDGLDCNETDIADSWINNAIGCCSFECIRWMLSKGVNLHHKSPGGWFALHNCIDRKLPDKYEVMQLLINSGADINVGTELKAMALNGWSPLHMAAARNDLEAIKALLDNGADTTLKTIIDDCCTAEQEAVRMNNSKAAELIRTYTSNSHFAGERDCGSSPQ